LPRADEVSEHDAQSDGAAKVVAIFEVQLNFAAARQRIWRAKVPEQLPSPAG